MVGIAFELFALFPNENAPSLKTRGAFGNIPS